MPRNAVKVLAEINSYCSHPALITKKVEPRYRIGRTLGNTEGSLLTNQAFIEEQDIVIAPKDPIELDGDKLKSFFDEIIPIINHNSGRALHGGIIRADRTYYTNLQLGATWINSEYPDKSVLWKPTLEITDPEISARVGDRLVDFIQEDRLPFQQMLTIYQMPSEDLAGIATDILNHPARKYIAANFDIAFLSAEQVQMIHEGQDPFQELKQRLAVIRTPDKS